MTTATSAPPALRADVKSNPHRLNILRALRGEWIKLSTLSSTWWSIAVTAVLTVGIALLIAGTVSDPSFGAIQAATLPIQFTMLLAGIMGAIAVTGEYSTGMIRSTLTADPVRGSVLAAKAIALAVTLFVASLVIFLAAALIVSPVMGGPGIDWSEPSESIVPLLAASLAMSVFALIGVAFGFILRSGPGAIAATVGVLFVAPIVLQLLAAQEWALTIAQRLPMAAAQSIIVPGSGGLEVPEAYFTLAAWVVAGMLGAWAVLRTRDA